MGFMKFDAIPEAKYLCDTIEDLSTLLPRPGYGDTCWVISEACEYICNSKGEWLPKEKASKTTANVDLTGYATEDFVQEQIQNIEHPVVEVPSKLSELENDANYAQQAYVDTKVADLVNSAPETLDTIGEIAQALKDHQNVADAITEAIGKKADKANLPSIEGLASEAFVTEAIQKIEFPVTDLSNYYTRDEVTQAIADSVELPEVNDAHMQLVTNANGEMVWEERSHWMEEQEDYLVNTSGNGKYISYPGFHNLKPNKEYTIVHNGTEYKCISQEINGIAVLGNLKYMNPSYEDTGEPFFFPGVEKDLVTFYAMFTEEGEHTFSIFGPVDIAKPLSELYVPQSVPVVKLASKGQAVVVGDVKNGHPTRWTTATIPTKVSELDNDAKHATEEYVNSLLGNKADSTDIVQANWDENNSESNAYVMNRPFYDSRTNVIEWDGETSDTIITIPKMNVTLYRVSDTPLTKAELGTVTEYDFGSTKGYTNLNSDLAETADKKIIHESQSFSFVSVLEDGAIMPIGDGVEDVVFEKKGIYFWELKFSATMSFKTQKIRYGAVTQIPDYYISDRIARQDTVQWINQSTPKTFLIYATYLDQDVITEVHPGGYIAGSGKNYTNDLADALSYDDIKQYFNYAPNWAKTINIAWHPSEDVLEKRQAIDLHLGEDGIGFHFIKDITFDETTGQPKFNLKKVWIANPEYVAE